VKSKDCWKTRRTLIRAAESLAQDPVQPGNVRLVGQGGGSFPRGDALLEPFEIVVLELEHQLVYCASIVLEESTRVASHLAEQSAGLPNLQQKVAFLCGALSKLDAHGCWAT